MNAIKPGWYWATGPCTFENPARQLVKVIRRLNLDYSPSAALMVRTIGDTTDYAVGDFEDWAGPVFEERYLTVEPALRLALGEMVTAGSEIIKSLEKAVEGAPTKNEARRLQESTHLAFVKMVEALQAVKKLKEDKA